MSFINRIHVTFAKCNQQITIKCSAIDLFSFNLAKYFRSDSFNLVNKLWSKHGVIHLVKSL